MSDLQPQPEPDRYVGQQVRLIRGRRGLTQQVLADRVGISRSVLAKYETGLRPVDSRKVLLALAGSLDVDLSDLTGREQERFDPTTAAFHIAVPELETVLWSRGNVTDVAPPRGLDELAALSVQATKLRNDCEYATLGPMLAPMLIDAYRHVHDAPADNSEKAYDVLGTVLYGVASALRARGYHALAWNAAQEAESAAAHVGQPAPIAAAAFAQAQILLSRPGALPAALETTVGTAKKINSEVRTVGDIETYGMLHLQGSIVAATMGRDPEPHLAEAAEQASRLAAAQPNTSVARNDSFGVANVALWRMSAAVERQEPGKVLALAPGLSPNELPNKGRQAHYFVEIGRAQGQQKGLPVVALFHSEGRTYRATASPQYGPRARIGGPYDAQGATRSQDR